MIKCKNLSYQNVLKKINFALKKGRVAVLLGLKGSGKTTLLNCLSGNYIAKGEIYLGNCRYLKELPSFCEELTGFEYLELLMTFSDIKNKMEIDKLVTELYLDKELSKKIKDSSLLTRRFLILISSFCLESNTILIDEPFYDFNIKSQRFIVEILNKLKLLGKTIIIATNDLDASYQIADELLILHKGKIKQIENKFNNQKQYEELVLSHLMN